MLRALPPHPTLASLATTTPPAVRAVARTVGPRPPGTAVPKGTAHLRWAVIAALALVPGGNGIAAPRRAEVGPSLLTDGLAGPRLHLDLPLRFAAAQTALRTHLATLRGRPSAAALRTALQGAKAAVAELFAVIDAAHHATDLAAPLVRPVALALRPLLAEARSGEGALLVLTDDVWLLRAEVQDTLADALLAAGDREGALQARIDAVAADAASAARLTLLSAALAAAGHGDAAALMAARARALTAGAKSPEPPAPEPPAPKAVGLPAEAPPAKTRQPEAPTPLR